MRKQLLILNCSGKKSDEPGAIPATDRYRPGAFYQILHQFPKDRWPHILIMSAKYGWIFPENRIVNYDKRMDQQAHEEIRDSFWQHEMVKSYIKNQGLEDADVFVAMGREYWMVVKEFLPELPSGKYRFTYGGIGMMRGQLKSWLEEVTSGSN